MSVSWGTSFRTGPGRGTSFSKLTSINGGAWHQIIPLYLLVKVTFFCFHATNSASKCLLLRLSVCEPGLSVIEQFYSMASCSTIICVIRVNKVLHSESFVLLFVLTNGISYYVCFWNRKSLKKPKR